MERETGVQPVLLTSENAAIAVHVGNDNQLLRSGCAMFVSRIASSIFRSLECFYREPMPDCHRAVVSPEATFPGVSARSSRQLLVCYPVDREANHFVCIRKAEFFFYVRAMSLNGFDAKIDLFGD